MYFDISNVFKFWNTVREPFRDFPGETAGKTPPSSAGGVDSILGQGAKIPYAVQHC